MIPTLPLAARNRLAHVILAAVHDGDARRELETLASSASPPMWLDPGGDDRHARLRARARSAADALRARPARAPDSLAETLDAAQRLFDAGLGFEVHELLEPCWLDAHGPAREALQGLIQVAVGYQHLANGNVAGARSLLGEGAARLAASSLGGLDLRGFGHAVEATVRELPQVGVIPEFPRFPADGRTR